MKLRLAVESADLVELLTEGLAARGYHVDPDHAQNIANTLLTEGTSIDILVTQVARPAPRVVTADPASVAPRKRVAPVVQELPTPPAQVGLSHSDLKDPFLDEDAIAAVRAHNTARPPEEEPEDPDNSLEVVDEIANLLKTSTDIQRSDAKAKKKVLQ